MPRVSLGNWINFNFLIKFNQNRSVFYSNLWYKFVAGLWLVTTSSIKSDSDLIKPFKMVKNLSKLDQNGLKTIKKVGNQSEMDQFNPKSQKRW